MRRRRLALVLVLLPLAVLAPACGDDDDEPGAATDGITEPTDVPDDADETGRSELEDGRHFGYWDSFDIGDTVAVGEFDLAYFLTGEDAEAEAARRGDEVDNDYYIVNDNDRLRTLFADGDTEVQVLAGEGTRLRSVNVAEFAVERDEGYGYWVTIVDGIVTDIEQQYVP